MTELPYGHVHGLRQLCGLAVAITEEETATRNALQAEFDELEAKYTEAQDIPQEVDRRLGEIEAALEAFDERPVVYEPDDTARAGAFVSIDSAGALRVERGYVRPEDESPIAAGGDEDDRTDPERMTSSGKEPDTDEDGAVEEPEGDDGMRPLSDRLMTELTAHRTLALREAIANDPDIALRAALHVLCLKLFYRYGFDSCLEIEAKSILFGHTSGLADTPACKAIDARHKAWAEQIFEDPGDLWDRLAELDGDSRQSLFAHCVGLTINAVVQPYDRRPKALRHAGRLASAVSLDMVAAGWRPTVDAYLGRITKARILEAVREAKGETAAERIAHLKKPEMTKEAERLLDGTSWLPEPLHTAGAKGAKTDEGDHTLPVMAAE